MVVLGFNRCRGSALSFRQINPRSEMTWALLPVAARLRSNGTLSRNLPEDNTPIPASPPITAGGDVATHRVLCRPRCGLNCDNCTITFGCLYGP